MRCLLLLALTGCIVVPKHTDTTRQIGTYTTPPIPGKLGPIELQITESYSTVHVTAQRSRHCFREVRGRYEHRHDTEAQLVGLDGGGGGDPRGLLLAAIISVPVVLISGAITAGVTAVDHPTVEQYEQTLDVVRAECPAIAARVDLDLLLPSGATIQGTTDANGALSIAIPASEPAQGIAVVRAPGVEQTVAYSRERDVAFAPPSANVIVREPPRPAPRTAHPVASVAEQRTALEQRGFTAVRDALRTCGQQQGVRGIVAAQLAIDTTGRVTSSPDHGGPAFASCVNDALADARFPDGRAQKLVFPYQL